MRTVVDPVHRAWVAESVARANSLLAIARPTAAADTSSVEHMEGSEQLHFHFPNHRCACLIGQWSRLCKIAPNERLRLPALLQLLSGWDAIVLILDGEADPVLDAVLTSALAPRIGLAQVATSEAGLTPTVVRVLAVARQLPPARVPLAPVMVSRVQALPDEVSVRVFDALRAPSEWNVKRLRASGVPDGECSAPPHCATQHLGIPQSRVREELQSGSPCRICVALWLLRE